MTDIFSNDGEYPVSVSPAVLDALKSARNQRQPNSRSAVSSSAKVFSIRYGFRPDSLDLNAPSQMSKDDITDDYVIQTPGTHTAETHLFRGQATQAKENEYALVFNPSTNSFDLKVLDFTLRVNPSREKPRKGRPSTPSTSAAGSNSSSNGSSASASASGGSGSNGSNGNLKPKSSTSSSASSRSHSPADLPLAERHRVVSKSLPSRPSDSQNSKKTATNGTSKTATKPSTKPTSSSGTSTGTGTGADAGSSSSSAPLGKKKARRPAQKRPVSSGATKSAAPADDADDEDDDLLGALANELEESLEDDSNESTGGPAASRSPLQDESEDEDQVMENNVMVLDSSAPPSRSRGTPINSAFNSPSLGTPRGGGGPISLRGFVGRPEEEELSSSEEE